MTTGDRILCKLGFHGEIQVLSYANSLVDYLDEISGNIYYTSKYPTVLEKCTRCGRTKLRKL